MRRVRVSILLFLFFAATTRVVVAQELKFGFTPVFSKPEMRAEFEPLMKYLSDSIGRSVHFT